MIFMGVWGGIMYEILASIWSRSYDFEDQPNFSNLAVFLDELQNVPISHLDS